MQPIEIVVIVIAAALVCFTIVFNVIKRKKKKCGDCKSCSKYACPYKETIEAYKEEKN